MKATTQHGFHPDAESLNAFAEQALSKREREQVLAHLAVCGRCRRVVALAGEAADAEAVVAKAQQATAAARAWWRNWWLASVPAAALAATAALAVYVHVRNVERSAEMAKVEPQSEAPPAAMAPVAAQQAPEEAAPAPSAKAHEKTVSPAPPAAAARAREHAAAAPQRVPDVTQDHFETGGGPAIPGRDEQALANRPGTPAARQSSLGAVHGVGSGYVQRAPAPAPLPPQAGTGEAPEVYKVQPTPEMLEAQKLAEQKRQADVTQRHLMAARAAAPAAVPSAAPAPPPSRAAETVTVTASPAPETQPIPAAPAGSAAIAQAELAPNAPSAARAIHLPSGLAAVSIAAAGRRELAIDQAGTLFISDNRGNKWEPVAVQWTGRAVVVRRRVAVNGVLPFASAAQAETSSNSSTETSPASSPTIFFELLNDQNQVWLSTDGRTWTAQ